MSSKDEVKVKRGSEVISYERSQCRNMGRDHFALAHYILHTSRVREEKGIVGEKKR